MAYEQAFELETRFLIINIVSNERKKLFSNLKYFLDSFQSVRKNLLLLLIIIILFLKGLLFEMEMQ